MDTIVFGHLTWEVMSYLASYGSEAREEVLLILAALTLLIPCEPCRRFYLSCWCIHPPDPHQSLVDWVYDIHAIVNAKIRVTKSSSVDPAVCLAPALSRQELRRRYACLSPGAAISTQGFLDFMLITAHGAKRHPKDGRRVQAWKVMMGALAKIFTLNPYTKVLAKATRKMMERTSSTTKPWTMALHLSQTLHHELKLDPPSSSALEKRLNNACGPLCDWLKKDLDLKP